jgi:uncharacterized protein with HEPN domain
MDFIRLEHIRDAIIVAVQLAGESSRADLQGDLKLELALARCVEIVGEAANQLSEETRTSISEVPWRQVIGMRHRLVHAYFNVDLNHLWDTIEGDLPPLLEVINRVLAEHDEQHPG